MVERRTIPKRIASGATGIAGGGDRPSTLTDDSIGTEWTAVTVELETETDRNDDLLDALELRNRMTN